MVKDFLYFNVIWGKTVFPSVWQNWSHWTTQHFSSWSFTLYNSQASNCIIWGAV